MTQPTDTPQPAPETGALRRVALLLEYDGTSFSGSQSQQSGRTVQDVLEAAIVQFTGERQRVAFAGRTDAGVHARGQVATLDTSSGHAPATVMGALNHYLPEEIAVRAAATVALDFDARRSARSRRYRYELDDGGERSPLRRHRAWQRRERLDVAAMAEAAEALPRGAQDWAAFAGPVAEGYSTVRELLDVDVRRCTARRLAVTMEATGFLPHQVRRTVGALERVGAGKLGITEFARLIDGPPASAGPVAPPQGLTLMAVEYRPGTLNWSCAHEAQGGTA
jgi:tRNA pseudouridine38-40 synthase